MGNNGYGYNGSAHRDVNPKQDSEAEQLKAIIYLVRSSRQSCATGNQAKGRQAERVVHYVIWLKTGEKRLIWGNE